MPLPHTVYLPPPKDWNEFEDICLSCAKLRWNDLRFERNGRLGQKQDGVDVYNTLGNNVIGIQCKNTISGINQALVNSEISKAESFSPILNQLFIATTASRDSNIQKYVREISYARINKGQFSVNLLFWEDIVQDLAKDINEIKKFYPNFFSLHKSQLGTSSTREQDISKLVTLLKTIDVEAVVDYLDMSPQFISLKFLEHTDNFNRVILNPTFIINDKQLDLSLRSWLDSWNNVAKLIRQSPYNYISARDELSFNMPFDMFEHSQDQQIFDLIKVETLDFLKKHKDFCQFLSQNYREIDIQATSLFARQFY